VGDIDLDLFASDYLSVAVDSDTLSADTRSVEDRLKALRFLDATGVPTVVGLITVGKEPQAFIPGFYVQFVRFDGTSLTDSVVNQLEVGGPLPQLLREVDILLRSNVRTATSFVDRDREDNVPDYPLAALQQLVRNAIMHRTYETSNAPVHVYWFDDRVEIHSPGGLFGQVTREKFWLRHYGL